MIQKLNRRKWEIKPITPVDFIDDEIGIPFSFVQLKIERNSYDELKEELGIDNDYEKQKREENLEKIIKKICSVGVLSIDDKPIQIESEDILELFSIANEIIKISLKKFQNILYVNKNQIYLYHSLAKEYGVRPINILYPEGGYNSLDAIMFDSFILAHYSDEYSKMIEKHNKKHLRNSARRSF